MELLLAPLGLKILESCFSCFYGLKALLSLISFYGPHWFCTKIKSKYIFITRYVLLPLRGRILWMSPFLKVLLWYFINVHRKFRYCFETPYRIANVCTKVKDLDLKLCPYKIVCLQCTYLQKCVLPFNSDKASKLLCSELIVTHVLYIYSYRQMKPPFGLFMK